MLREEEPYVYPVQTALIDAAKGEGCIRLHFISESTAWNKGKFCFYFTYKEKGHRIVAVFYKGETQKLGAYSFQMKYKAEMLEDFYEKIANINRPKKLLLCL